MSIDRLYYLQISFKIVNYKIEKGMLSLLELRITALNKATISAETKWFFKTPRRAMVKLVRDFHRGKDDVKLQEKAR